MLLGRGFDKWRNFWRRGERRTHDDNYLAGWNLNARHSGNHAIGVSARSAALLVGGYWWALDLSEGGGEGGDEGEGVHYNMKAKTKAWFNWWWWLATWPGGTERLGFGISPSYIHVGRLNTSEWKIPDPKKFPESPGESTFLRNKVGNYSSFMCILPPLTYCCPVQKFPELSAFPVLWTHGV